MLTFRTFFQYAFAVLLHHKSEVFFRESEGFLRRVLGSYTHKFQKRGAASLMDLPELHL